MNKRILSLILAIVLLAASIPMTVNAASYSGNCGAQGDNLTWSLDTESGLLTINGTGAMSDFKASAPAEWYQHRANIKSIVIEDGVTSIGSYAFNKFLELKSIVLNDSIQNIGNNAFLFCANLSEVYVKDLKTWLSISFETPGTNPLSLGAALIINDEIVRSITIPDGITSIKDGAFNGYTYLTDVKIPQSVTYIGNSAFSECTALEIVNIPYGIEILESSVFNKCSALKTVVIPKSIKTISTSAFSSCDSLETVYYGGTEADFAEISVHSTNSALKNATFVYSFLKNSCGDVTGDGKVNTKDVLALRKHLGGIDIGMNILTSIYSDVTGDGKITTKDVLALRKFLGGIIVEFDAVTNQG